MHHYEVYCKGLGKFGIGAYSYIVLEDGEPSEGDSKAVSNHSPGVADMRSAVEAVRGLERPASVIIHTNNKIVENIINGRIRKLDVCKEIAEEWQRVSAGLACEAVSEGESKWFRFVKRQASMILKIIKC